MDPILSCPCPGIQQSQEVSLQHLYVRMGAAQPLHVVPDQHLTPREELMRPACNMCICTYAGQNPCSCLVNSISPRDGR